MFVKSGDIVLIISGRDKGKKGKVEKVYSKLDKVLVAGVNFYKKHLKGKGVIDMAMPLAASKVSVVCPKCGLATRIGQRVVENKKIRICKKCGEGLENE